MTNPLRRTVLSLILAGGLVLPATALHGVARADQGPSVGSPDLQGISATNPYPAALPTDPAPVLVTDPGMTTGTAAVSLVAGTHGGEATPLPSDFTPVAMPTIN